MDFNKLILGEDELHDFENLLIRERLIDINSDFNTNYEKLIKELPRNNNRRRLLISLLLYEKIDAVTLSSLDLSRLIDMGVVEENSCLTEGTFSDHPTPMTIDAGLEYKKVIISALCDITGQLLSLFHIDLYPKSLIKEEYLFDLCDSYLFGTQSDFIREYGKVIDRICNKLNYIGSEEDAYQMKRSIQKRVENIYCSLRKYKKTEAFQKYCGFLDELEANIQYYSVPAACMSCKEDWRECCVNSEFFTSYSYDCMYKERLGIQRFNKLNGLIMSNLSYGTLFDNSIRFKNVNIDSYKTIEDIYHIVNIDLSDELGSLPVPRNVAEAIRLRSRPEISSFRNVFLQWSSCMYNGDFSEAEYIKKDFKAASDFFKKKESEFQKSKSILHCTCEAVGSQIPYLSNITGIVTPFVNRQKILEEEKHRWLLLTR